MQAYRRLTKIGDVLRVARVVLLIATIATFLVFLYMDNLLSGYLQRTLQNELRQEGFYEFSIRPTPAEGFRLVDTIQINGTLRGSTLTHDETALYVADSNGRIIRVDVSAGDIQDVVTSDTVEAPHDVFLTDEDELLIADPGKSAVIYLTTDGDYIEEFVMENDIQPVRAVKRFDGRVLFLGQGDNPGLYTWLSDEAAPRLYYREQEQYDVQTFGEYTFLVGVGHNKIPVTQLSAVGINVFERVDVSDVWALQYWEVPFVAIDVDSHGFITIVDEEGHIVQMDSHGKVLLHTAPILADIEQKDRVQSISAARDGRIYIVFDSAIAVYELTEHGDWIRSAVLLEQSGRYEEALQLWQQTAESIRDSRIVHRALGHAYMNVGMWRHGAKQFVLTNDHAAFAESVAIRTGELRKAVLWPVLVAVVFSTIIIWVIAAFWPTSGSGGARR